MLTLEMLVFISVLSKPFTKSTISFTRSRVVSAMVASSWQPVALNFAILVFSPPLMAVPTLATTSVESSSSSHSVAAHGAAIVRASRTAPPAAAARPACHSAARPLLPTPKAERVVSIVLLSCYLSATLWRNAAAAAF